MHALCITRKTTFSQLVFLGEHVDCRDLKNRWIPQICHRLQNGIPGQSGYTEYVELLTPGVGFVVQRPRQDQPQEKKPGAHEK